MKTKTTYVYKIDFSNGTTKDYIFPSHKAFEDANVTGRFYKAVVNIIK